MRVLFISNLYPNPYHRHRAPWNRQQLAALANEHAVRVISPLSWTDESRWSRAQGLLLDASRRRSEGEIEVDHPKYWFPPKIARGWYGACFRRSIAATFRKAVEQFKPDVVLAAWAYPDGWAAAELARSSGLPCVIKVHGSDVLLLDEFPEKRHKTVEALRAADAIVAVSEDLRRAMTRLGVVEEKIEVVYDGVDTSVFHPGSRAEARDRLGMPATEPIALYVGNLLPVKGVDRLVSAAGVLKQQQATFRVRIVGGGPEQPKLERLAEELNVSDRITFEGPKEHGDLPDWFRAADVFCLPSHSEGVPNVLLEAAACTTPFVAFDVGGISEIAHLGESTLVDPAAPGELAAALRPYLGRPQPDGDARPFRSFADSANDLAAVLSAAVSRQPARQHA